MTDEASTAHLRADGRAIALGWIIGTALQLQQSALWPWTALLLATLGCVLVGLGMRWSESRAVVGPANLATQAAVDLSLIHI